MNEKRWPGRNRTADLGPEWLIPKDVQAWDYWRIGESAESPTGLAYGICVQKGDGPSFRIVTLTRHAIREHDDDGTISVRPGDCSSNSILVSDSSGEIFHGYIDHGVFHL